MIRVGVYSRISLDIEGEGFGVERQQEDCRRLAEQRGWQIAQQYCDNSVSAYKKVRRPAFEAMLEDLKNNVIDGVATYDLDRLARQPKDLERLIDIFDSRPLMFAAVTGEIDLSTSDGRFIARLFVNLANKSSADTGRRVKRSHLQLAQRGVPVGGWRPFGYEKDKKTLNEKEAALIRQAVSDLLAGVSLHSIVRDWNQRGITTTRGRNWKTSTFRQMLIRPRAAGYRMYQAKLLYDDKGQPVKGQWEAVIDPETWERLCIFLDDPARKRSIHTSGRKYFLSGLMRCALCTSTLTGMAITAFNTFTYRCPAPTQGGCGKVSINGPKTDELIENLVLKALAERQIEHEAIPWPREEELQKLSTRQFELMEAFGKGEVPGDVAFPTINKLNEEVDVLKKDKAAYMRDKAAVSITTDLSESWPTLAIDQRRAIVDSLFQAVLLKPRRPESPQTRFDPLRVDVIWREQ